MKALSSLLLCLMCIYACKPSKMVTQGDTSLSSIQLHEGAWYSNFKNEVFIRCLKKMYPNELAASMDATDASSAANVEWLEYSSDVLGTVDSLADAFVKRKEAMWTLENKKVAMNVCLGYRNSAELDAITVSVYNKLHAKQD
jgi:hypothetical protein